MCMSGLGCACNECITCMQAVSTESRRGHQIPWGCYIWLCIVLWVLITKPGQPVLLSTELSLWPKFKPLGRKWIFIYIFKCKTEKTYYVVHCGLAGEETGVGNPGVKAADVWESLTFTLYNWGDSGEFETTQWELGNFWTEGPEQPLVSEWDSEWLSRYRSEEYPGVR